MKLDSLCIDINVPWNSGDGQGLLEFFHELCAAERGHARKVVKLLREWRAQCAMREVNVFETEPLTLETREMGLSALALSTDPYATFVHARVPSAALGFGPDSYATFVHAGVPSAPPPYLRVNRLSLSVFASLRRALDVVDFILWVWSNQVVGLGRPRKRLLPMRIGRVWTALLGLLSGFFGPHKVDGRNNP